MQKCNATENKQPNAEAEDKTEMQKCRRRETQKNKKTAPDLAIGKTSTSYLLTFVAASLPNSARPRELQISDPTTNRLIALAMHNL